MCSSTNWLGAEGLPCPDAAVHQGFRHCPAPSGPAGRGKGRNLGTPALEKTFAKGLTLLETLVAMEEPASVTRLGNMLGLYKSNVHRLLRTLVDSGYVVQIEDGRYMPSLRLTEMGEAVWAAIDLERLAGPALRDLAAGAGQGLILASAERGGLRVRAVAGPDAGLPAPGSALPMQGSARLLADLLRREGLEDRVLVLPHAGAAGGAGQLCLAPVPDLRLPAPLALGLAAPAGRAQAAEACALAERLAQILSGAGPAIPGRTPVSV